MLEFPDVGGATKQSMVSQDFIECHASPTFDRGGAR